MPIEENVQADASHTSFCASSAFAEMTPLSQKLLLFKEYFFFHLHLVFS